MQGTCHPSASLAQVSHHQYAASFCGWFHWVKPGRFVPEWHTWQSVNLSQRGEMTGISFRILNRESVGP